MIVTRSVKIAPRVYRLAASASLDSALITIRGDNITVDLSGVTIAGIDPDADPDLAAGVAIKVEGGSNIRISGGAIRGYKVGILARGTRGLTIERADLSYNWKPRLYSLVEHESLADWLSFHHNEHGEWLRFGAAIYLDSVSGGAVRHTRAVQGMNALLLNRSDHLHIEYNDFSFNSGLGIGLYRSSDNQIVYNVVDYDVRGYSHGFYRRGQDSAGMLLYEQSCRNLIAWNSATHGGDGFFLWAGQSTMDSGTGGANDNVVFGNDFSFAPANGIEATFSRNTFIGNLLEGNDYGVWGGYSFESKIIANVFVRNRTGIAIEHGQDNVIAGNGFDHDTVAINLWANAIEPSDWGYPRHHDTRSHDYRIETNMFAGNRVGLRVANTAGTAFSGNRVQRVDSLTVLRDSSVLDQSGNVAPFAADTVTIPSIPAEYRSLAPMQLAGAHEIPVSGHRRSGRSDIVVDEWGPYDYFSPKLWPVDSTHASPLRLAVRGPAGRWQVVQRRNISSISDTTGPIGDTIAVTPSAPDDWEITLEYRGGATVSPRGRPRTAGVAYRFSYGRFEPVTRWTVRFFVWSDSTKPGGPAFDSLLDTTPRLTRTESRLDYMWYAPPRVMGLPQSRFAIKATATVTLPLGSYTLRTISDDAVRVWVDGRLVIDDWTPHESAVDDASITGGRHDIRVLHYQSDGWTELRVDFVKGIERSRGSPGPH